MANYKRGKCRYYCPRAIRGSRASQRAKEGVKPVRPRSGLKPWEDDEYWNAKERYSWLGSWPRWHDLLFHTRPHRAATKRLERAIRNGADPDDMSWPIRRKPHKYYW